MLYLNAVRDWFLFLGRFVAPAFFVMTGLIYVITVVIACHMLEHGNNQTVIAVTRVRLDIKAVRIEPVPELAIQLLLCLAFGM